MPISRLQSRAWNDISIITAMWLYFTLVDEYIEGMRNVCKYFPVNKWFVWIDRFRVIIIYLLRQIDCKCTYMSRYF